MEYINKLNELKPEQMLILHYLEGPDENGKWQTPDLFAMGDLYTVEELLKNGELSKKEEFIAVKTEKYITPAITEEQILNLIYESMDDEVDFECFEDWYEHMKQNIDYKLLYAFLENIEKVSKDFGAYTLSENEQDIVYRPDLDWEVHEGVM
jgi:hypothetical protein